MDDHFHRLTFEVLLILFLYPFLFHGSLHSTLSFRVRQIGGVSKCLSSEVETNTFGEVDRFSESLAHSSTASFVFWRIRKTQPLLRG